MAIKNYTSSVDVYVSLGEIQAALAKAGATKIMVDYDSTKPVAVTFGINTAAGVRGFRLPAAVDGTIRVFARQKVKADRAQAERTAWRNVRDWVLAQIALVESCDAEMDEVFLPYLMDEDGNTLYQAYSKREAFAWRHTRWELITAQVVRIFTPGTVIAQQSADFAPLCQLQNARSLMNT